MRLHNRRLVMAGTIALAVVGALVALAFATMDNPTPPLHKVELPTGPGYCVSVGLGDRYFGKVFVPMGKPDPANLELQRISIANVYRLVALQVPDPLDQAALRAAAEQVKFSGEPDTTAANAPTAAFASLRKNPHGGGVTCACATYYGGDVVGSKHACGGECSNCYLCR